MGGSKMFPFISKTWNPVKGCLYGCVYCWARSFAEGRLRAWGGRYSDGFKPALIEEELDRRFRKNDFVFVADMGDLFGEWVPDDWIMKVFECIRRSPEARFLLLTKNPDRYGRIFGDVPDNCVLGATVESNRDYDHVSKAPLMSSRLEAMKRLRLQTDKELFISVEPIMDFDLMKFVRDLEEIKPCMVAVGYDNYGHDLIEPELEKTEKFIEKLGGFTEAVRKSLREALRGT